MNKIILFFIIAGLTGVLVNCSDNTKAPCTAGVDQATIDAIPKTQLNTDIARISTYLASQHITTATEDPSGLRYLITTLGTGTTPPCLETKVTVKYSGRILLADDMSLSTTFDSSTSATFPLSNLILGWKIAFLKLPKGSAATLYLPSGMAYGLAGSPPRIGSNAVLVFQVELVDF